MSVVIAVDGPVAAGKGTLARRLAQHFGFAYLDTGAIYRAAALRSLIKGIDPTDTVAAVAAARQIHSSDLASPHLREEEVGHRASVISAIPEVRHALIDWQRDFAAGPPGGEPGAVLDGRDIGTVVCPDANVKLYVTAAPEVRARRRWLELTSKGDQISEAQVLADLKDRDARDQSRDVAPLKPAADAVIIDTSAMDADQAFQAALKAIGD